MDRLKLNRLREALDYNAITGVFTWRIKASPNTRIGSVAGNTHVFGYKRIRLDKVLYWAHRLAWFHYHGSWPKNEIDHINCDKGDNRIANLRDVTTNWNRQNIKTARGKSKTGMLGVYPAWNRYTSKIRVDGQTHYLGMFSTPQEAHSAYVHAKRKLHPAGTL